MSEQKTGQKHTPGPWKAFTEPKFSGWWSVCDSGERELGSGDGGFEEADARLIAAAPELLEALKLVTDVYASMRETLSSKYPADGWSAQTMTIDAARAAIAKATGEDAA